MIKQGFTFSGCNLAIRWSLTAIQLFFHDELHAASHTVNVARVTVASGALTVTAEGGDELEQASRRRGRRGDDLGWVVGPLGRTRLNNLEFRI